MTGLIRTSEGGRTVNGVVVLEEEEEEEEEGGGKEKDVRPFCSPFFWDFWGFGAPLPPKTSKNPPPSPPPHCGRIK